MKSSLNHLCLGAVALGMTSLAPLHAATLPITVVNPGFESPILGDGASISTVAGWQAYGDAKSYAWNPGVSYYAYGVPEGQNVGDLYQSAAFTGFSQVLQGAQGQFLGGVSYELKVKVGRNLLDAYEGYIIQLAVNDTVIAQDDNSRVPAAGSFISTSLKYTYNAALHSGLIGYPIEVRLLAKGLSGGIGDVNFDDVQLTYQTSNAVADHGGPYRVSQGSSLALNGSASVPSDGAASITLYEWDLDGDGDYDENITGAVPVISYANLTNPLIHGMEFGANAISLRVTDNLNQTAVSTTTVTIFIVRTYTGPATSRGQDEKWNVSANWTGTQIPEGLVDVVIPASKQVPCNSTVTPAFTGNLSIGSGSSIQCGWLTAGPDVYNALGTPGETIITMSSGSSLNFRAGQTPRIPAIVLNGNASITLGSSTQGGAQASFDYPITGAYRLTFYGNSQANCVANFNTPNTFNEIYSVGAPYVDGGLTLVGNAPGSLGAGNLTLDALSGGGNSAVIVINAENSIADTATVSMNGNTATKITMNANDTIASLVINGVQMPAGTYGSPGSSATYKQTWIAGNAILTVTDGQGIYWDTNGATAGAGGANPSGDWNSASSNWSNSATGGATTASWLAGGNAVFSAGSDATGAYTVTVGGSNAITLTNLFTASQNTGTSSFSVTRSGWALNGGNCVAVLVSSLNATGFTASYNGQAMTVQGVYETRNSYTGIAYIIGDALPATGNVVINVPYVKAATNTGAYGNMGTVYSILSLSNVASAGTAATRTYLSNPPTTASMTYSTSINNSFVLGVASDSNWSTSLRSVVGKCSEIISTAKPAYFNTIQCYGTVTAAGTYTDVYSNKNTALITLPLNAKTTSNPLLLGQGQKIGGLKFEEGAVTVAGSRLELQTSASFTTASTAGLSTIGCQIAGLPALGPIKKGPGTLVLSNAANDYTGPTSILNGTLRLGISSALPNTPVLLAGDAPGVVATLDLNGYNATIGGLTLGGSSITSGSSVMTGEGVLTLSGNVEYDNANAPLGSTISGNLSLGASTRTLHVRDSSSVANDLSVPAVISGTGGLSKIGAGTLLLSGNNTYTGMTTVSGGLLVLSGTNASATGGITVNYDAAVRFDTPASINGTGQNVKIEQGGVVYFSGSFDQATIASALANRIDPSSTGVIGVDNYVTTSFDFGASGLNVFLGALNDVTYTGVFSPNAGEYRIGGGSGTITLTGANALSGANNLLVGGSVVIANSNDLTGSTTINSYGRLQLGAGGSSGSLSSSSAITNDGMLVFNRSDTLTQGTHFWSNIPGLGFVQQSGSGVTVLNANNSYSGGTILLAGTLKLGHDNAIGSGQLSIYSGTLDVAGPGALTMASDNPVSIGGNFSFGGTANLNMGEGNLNILTDSVITLNGTGKTLTFGGNAYNASGGGQTLSVDGAGNTLVLGGYKMSNNINAFNMAITIGGTGNVAISGAVDDWSYYNDDPYDTRLGTLTKTGSGTLTLAGVNVYTGNTVVNGGVLHLLNSSVSPASQRSHIIVNNGGTLAFTLGTSITSTNKLTLNPGHKIRIVGTPTMPSYTLMTASSIVGGSPTLETAISGYFLEVAGNELRLTQLDNTKPVLLSSDIVDDKGGGPITPNTLVTYTLSFSEDINHTSVTSADFGNAGTSSITIGAITEISPGIFTVQVTPTTAGTLEFQIIQNAVILDMALVPNALDTSAPIVDETSITVEVPNTSWLVGSDIEDDQGGADIAPNTLVTYTLYFARDIDHTTVTAADFANSGSCSVTFGAITEISPGTFTVEVTPTSLGTLRLAIPTTADIRDPSNNILDDDPAIEDDTTINVVDAFTIWAGTGFDTAFGDDQNGDGIANGLAWLLGATTPGENARARLPLPDEDAGDLTLSFITLDASKRGTATMKVQYSKDMGATDLWSSHEAEVPTTPGTSTVNGISFDVQSLEDGFLNVVARVPAAAAGTGKKLFSRISATAP